MARSFQFELLEAPFAVCRLSPAAPLPTVLREQFCSLTVTDGELSYIGAWESAPAGARIEGPYRVFRIIGPLEFSAIGIIAEISGLFATAGISLLTISTFDTDYFLVRTDCCAVAGQLLRGAGHTVRSLEV